MASELEQLRQRSKEVIAFLEFTQEWLKGCYHGPYAGTLMDDERTYGQCLDDILKKVAR